MLEAHNFLQIDRTADGDVIFCLPGLLGRYPRYTSVPENTDPLPNSLITFVMEVAGVPFEDYEHLLG